MIFKGEEMIDLHCHILPAVDDGSKNMEETIAILKKAEKAGFQKICFTPHYAEPTYINTKQENLQILEQVKRRMRDENISIEVFLGNEIFIHEDMELFLENGKVSTLADSSYVLIELPMYQELPQEVVKKMLYKVKEKGFQVVIAHPERYVYLQKKPKQILEYFGEDVIFQGNYGSIIGGYGKEAQKTIKKLLKNKIIHYFSSDVHQFKRCFYDVFDEINKKLQKMVDEEYFEKLTQINPKLVIENREVKNENMDGN